MDLKKPEVVFRLQMVDVGGADKGLGGDAQVRWGSYSAFTFTLSQRPKQACGNRRQHEPQLSTLAALGERCAMRACAALRFAQVPPRFYFGRVVAKYQCLEAVGQRGKYEFFDAIMTFTTGVVDFSAGNMTNPDLDIKGNIRGKQVTANVAVGGTAQAPEVTLTSTPPLPQDEILSRVFFDKSVTELTPMEMVRIAQIIGVMTGKIGSGMDPISRLRKKAGIDMLSVNRDDKTGDTSVSVGKYLSDGIYMSVDQGVNTQGSAVKLQIELKPNLQVETRVGNDNDNSVGLNWKKDY